MSENVSGGNRPGGVGVEQGLQALRQGGTFRGPVESLDDGDHGNNHFAVIYETEKERFDAVVPFIQQGLDRGEKCLYVVDGDPDEVQGALREGGIDVDAARESGALTFASVEETYLRQEQFDPEAIASFYADVIDDTTEEWDGLRVTAGTDWIDEVPIDAFMEYESRVNELFEARDAMALCHYDRSELSPGVIRDMIRTHPRLIYDSTVCHNVYYTPPDELVGSADKQDEIDRMLGTVRDRALAKTEVAQHRQFLRELNEITASTDRSFEEKLQAIFDLGCEWFDLDLGALNKVNTDEDVLEVQYVNDDHDYFEPGFEIPLSETYCQAAADVKGATSVADPPAEGFDDIIVFEDFGVEGYLGTYVPIDGGVDRTLAFVPAGAVSDPFTREDRTYLELMGQWVKYELERKGYERELEATIDRLTQSNDRLKQFTYAASHDLQEPLRMVSSYLRLLENDYGDDLKEGAQECLDFAIEGADRMRAMVDDLLAYSRVEQSEGNFESTDCNEVLERVTQTLQAQIEETNADVYVDSLPTVMADADQLEQLFRNLVSNAIKYNGENDPRVEISADRGADHWEFAVADEGIGIDSDKTDQIFEVFNRLHHDDEYQGTGIGLALCQEIVENHGGDIRVESEPGEGSTFFVTLPRRTGL